MTGLVIAGVPLVAALIARNASPRTRVAGLLTGLAGVGLLVGFHGGTGGAVPLLELLGVVLCYATGPLIIERWLADVPRYGVSAASLIVGALLFAPVAVPDLPSLARTVTPGPALAALALAVICTALAFVLFFALIAEVGGVRATVITFVNPAVAVVLGAVVLHEEITPLTVGAFVLILAGSFLATRRRTAGKEPTPDPDARPRLIRTVPAARPAARCVRRRQRRALAPARDDSGRAGAPSLRPQGRGRVSRPPSRAAGRTRRARRAVVTRHQSARMAYSLRRVSVRTSRAWVRCSAVPLKPTCRRASMMPTRGVAELLRLARRSRRRTPARGRSARRPRPRGGRCR